FDAMLEEPAGHAVPLLRRPNRKDDPDHPMRALRVVARLLERDARHLAEVSPIPFGDPPASGKSGFEILELGKPDGTLHVGQPVVEPDHREPIGPARILALATIQAAPRRELVV